MLSFALFLFLWQLCIRALETIYLLSWHYSTRWVHCSVKGARSYNFTSLAHPLLAAVCQVIILLGSEWKVLMLHKLFLPPLLLCRDATKIYTSSRSSQTLVSSPLVCHQPYTLHCISFWFSHCCGFYFSSNTYGKGAFGPQESFPFWNISEFVIGNWNKNKVFWTHWIFFFQIFSLLLWDVSFLTQFGVGRTVEMFWHLWAEVGYANSRWWK